jgi:TnpA family transposase
VVNVGVRDSTYVLDGLLYHESDLRIEEHYTDTAGFTDHVFALMHLPSASRRASATSAKPSCTCRRRALPDVAPADRRHPEHQARACPLGRHPAPGQLDQAGHRHRLADAAQARQLPAPERTGRGLRELGRIERTLFILDWLQSVELRRRVHAGLNKGEARNSLAGRCSSTALGKSGSELEQQRYRASGLNLVTAAIVLWNTVYLERATQGVGRAGAATASCCSCRRWAGSTST